MAGERAVVGASMAEGASDSGGTVPMGGAHGKKRERVRREIIIPFRLWFGSVCVKTVSLSRRVRDIVINSFLFFSL